jgi:hypothetical protein
MGERNIMRRQSKITQNPSVNPGKEAVGVAKVSRGEQMIAKSVTDFTAAMHEREVKANNLAAMAKYGDWGREYAMKKAKLQQDYRDNPKEFPKAAQEMGDSLSREFQKGMKRGVSNRFKEITTNAIAQDTDNNANWAIARDQEIIVGDIEKGFNDVVYAAEFVTQPEELNQLLGENRGDKPYTDFSLASQAFRARDFISESSVQKMKKQYRGMIIENAMNSAMLDDPRRVYAELAKGDDSGYHNILTPTEMKSYLAKAKSIMVNQSIVGKFKTLSTEAVEVSELLDKIVTTGGLSVADMSRRLEWAEANKGAVDDTGAPIISENYIRNLRSLKDFALGMDTRTTKEKTEDENTYKYQFTTKWENFLSNRKRKQKASPKDYDEVLGMYADLTRAHQSNIISEDKFFELKKVLDTRLKSDLGSKHPTVSLSEALKEAGEWKLFGWLTKPKDIYSYGYDEIREYVDSREDMDDEGKRELKEGLIIAYMNDVAKIDESVLSDIKAPEAFAKDRLYGGSSGVGIIHRMATFKDNDTGRVYKFGDDYKIGGVVGKVIGGVNGDVLIETPENFKKYMGNR